MILQVLAEGRSSIDGVERLQHILTPAGDHSIPFVKKREKILDHSRIDQRHVTCDDEECFALGGKRTGVEPTDRPKPPSAVDRDANRGEGGKSRTLFGVACDEDHFVRDRCQRLDQSVEKCGPLNRKEVLLPSPCAGSLTAHQDHG